MNVADILKELAGFYAYETGCTDSGVKDDQRRTELVAELRNAMELPDYRQEEAAWFKGYFLSEEAIADGYGVEDAYVFYRWLENDL